MRILMMLCVAFLLTSCGAGNYRYQTENNSMQWKGQNISAVESKWGAANDIMHARSGTSYYLYITNSTGNFYRSTTTNFSMNGGNAGMGAFPTNNNVGLKCTTTFTTDANGTITNVSHQGSDCGGEWVPKKSH